jgi:hypothetical protein
MDEVICDHAYKCHNIPNFRSVIEDCSGRQPHKYSHQEDSGFSCPHADGEWVKSIPTHLPNPELRRIV